MAVTAKSHGAQPESPAALCADTPRPSKHYLERLIDRVNATQVPTPPLHAALLDELRRFVCIRCRRATAASAKAGRRAILKTPLYVPT